MTRPHLAIAPPEPNLVPQAMIERAISMRALLRARQAQCEREGQVPDETSTELTEAGFFRIVQPRQFGGYEFDVPTFYRVMMELSRGCIETGWVVALTSGHPLLLAPFPEAAQREAYANAGDFRCPASFSPIGSAVAADGGYRVSGNWDSASGIDLATHFIGSANVQDTEPNSPPKLIQILIERSQFEIVDNWQVMGMRGTGSKRVVAKDIFVPQHRTLAAMGGSRGAEPLNKSTRLYENTMYRGRIQPFLIGEATAVAIGGAFGALDAYADLMRSKKSLFPPHLSRHEEPEFQLHFGRALALLSTAEAALLRAGEDYMDYAREESEGGAPFDERRDQRLVLIEQQATRLAWEAMELIYRTAGTTASAKDNTMIGRAFRNLAVVNTHPALQLDRFAVTAARTHFSAAPGAK